jgi:CRP-like cAMP-binding protein
LILEGSAEVRRRNRTLSKLKAGDFFGEMSLLDEKPRSADVIASSQTKCLVVSPSSLNRLISSSPNIAKQMLTEIAGRLRATTDLLSE